MSSSSRVIREYAYITADFVDKNGEKGVLDLVEKCISKAMDVATKKGYKDILITKMWSQKYGPLEAPAREIAPKSWQEIYPAVSVFAVTIRES